MLTEINSCNAFPSSTCQFAPLTNCQSLWMESKSLYFLFPIHFLCNHTTAEIGFASSLDTLTFLLWQPDGIPDHSWLNHLQKLHQLELPIYFAFWVLCNFPFLHYFCFQKVLQPFNGHSSCVFALASQQPAFVLFAVCRPDCFPSRVLLPHVCDAMLVVVAKSVKQQVMTGRAQSHQLLLLCSHLLHVCVNKWACKHAVTLLRLCAPRWAQLWCSFRLTSGSSLIRKPLDWRTQTQPLKSGKRGERQVGCAVRVRAERAATLSHFLALFSN